MILVMALSLPTSIIILNQNRIMNRKGERQWQLGIKEKKD
jgi:hypothetical protein